MGFSLFCLMMLYPARFLCDVLGAHFDAVELAIYFWVTTSTYTLCCANIKCYVDANTVQIIYCTVSKKIQIQLMLLSFYTFWHTLLVVIVGFIFIYLSTYFILFLFVFNLAILNLVPCIQTNLHFLNYYSMSLHRQGVYGSGENTSVHHMFGIVLTVLFFSFFPPPPHCSIYEFGDYFEADSAI